MIPKQKEFCNSRILKSTIIKKKSGRGNVSCWMMS